MAERAGFVRGKAKRMNINDYFPDNPDDVTPTCNTSSAGAVHYFGGIDNSFISTFGFGN